MPWAPPVRTRAPDRAHFLHGYFELVSVANNALDRAQESLIGCVTRGPSRWAAQGPCRRRSHSSSAERLQQLVTGCCCLLPIT